jgi:ribonucleotide reductase alpha subunit
MIGYDEVKIYTQPKLKDYNTYHYIKNTDIKIYNVLSIFKDGYNQPLFYNDDTKRYVRMEYQSRVTDWSMAALEVFSSGMFKQNEKREAVECSQENFESINK